MLERDGELSRIACYCVRIIENKCLTAVIKQYQYKTNPFPRILLWLKKERLQSLATNFWHSALSFSCALFLMCLGIFFSPIQAKHAVQSVLPWWKFQVFLNFQCRFIKFLESLYLWQIYMVFGFDKNVDLAKSSATFREMEEKKPTTTYELFFYL